MLSDSVLPPSCKHVPVLKALRRRGECLLDYDEAAVKNPTPSAPGPA